MTLDWRDQVDWFAPVTLEELNLSAALQRRTDRKYVITPEVWAQVLATMPDPRVLEIDGRREFAYESSYYDTDALTSYTQAAQRRPQRFKVRTRTYVDTGTQAIEVKLRERTGETVKHREWLAPRDVEHEGPYLAPAAREFVGGFPQIADAVADLSHTLTTAYTRVTLLTADARVTVDSDVRGRDPRDREVGFGELLIVETKSSSRAGATDRALWAHGARPQKVSKYCTSLAALRPELPSNRWARTLRRHLDTTEHTTGHTPRSRLERPPPCDAPLPPFLPGSHLEPR